ncbi:MAG: hypothetical protein QMC36_01465 [Patescibacteria group bacterium]
MIPIAPTPSIVEISPGVTVVLKYGIPKSREEALERLRDCMADPERFAPIYDALGSIDAKRVLKENLVSA